MGKYVNKGNADFAEARNQEYVDKSGLIGFVNRTLMTPAKMSCVSRARRFGKSLALQMLYAYYDCSCDSHSLFDDLTIAGVYMTGILPIKSYGTQSALNNFRMYSMTTPEPIEAYFGFSDAEVEGLCRKHSLDFQELSHWYNGYRLGNGGVRIFNPTSVMTVLTTRVCKGYWTRTESFESVRDLINLNFDGVKEALEAMLSETPTKVTVSTFGNDSNVVGSKDELFTLLIHYGYLGYDSVNQKAFIPNSEARQELMLAVRNGTRPELVKMIKDSELLLQKTLEGDGTFVAAHLDELHSAKSAPLFYNDEQALRSLIHFAYIAAVDDYVQIQELPSGKGCADVVFIPRKGSERPAMIVELKYDGAAEGAIAQIRDRRYPQVVEQLSGEVLLVGVNYEKKSKRHKCLIERWGESLSLSLSRRDLVTKLSLSSGQVDLLMESLQKPVLAKELRSLLGFKDPTYFKRNVLDVLDNDGLIAMTQPDKPTSPNQKYYLTEKGKKYL